MNASSSPPSLERAASAAAAIPGPRMQQRTFRIGQIVPSSNTTMETEIPAMLRARERVLPDARFTFHSSRMRMQKVTREQLAAMDGESLRCAVELADARMDVMGYACLVAIMAMGAGYHRESERRLGDAARSAGGEAPVVTSAGALVQVLNDVRARRIAMITPYMKPLTKLVAEYIEGEGVEVVDAIALEIEDNLEVGRRNPLALVEDAKRLATRDVDVVVISACVQMPSLPAIPLVERALGLPATSTAVCTTRRMLEALRLPTIVPDAGALLAESRQVVA